MPIVYDELSAPAPPEVRRETLAPPEDARANLWDAELAGASLAPEAMSYYAAKQAVEDQELFGLWNALQNPDVLDRRR